MFEFVFQAYLLGYVMNNAQHQPFSVHFKRAGVGLYISQRAVRKAMNEIERFVPSRQFGDLAHDWQYLPPEYIDFPRVLEVDVLSVISIKPTGCEIGIDDQAICRRVYKKHGRAIQMKELVVEDLISGRVKLTDGGRQAGQYSFDEDLLTFRVLFK